jgi:biotin carboxylase
MKKILIPGTGNAQVDFIKYCKQQGYEVHAISYKKEGSGIAYADHFAIINITDTEAIEKYARDHSIDLIYTSGSDLAMSTISEVTEKLGLHHFVSVKTARACNNKILLRQKLSNINDGNYTVKFLKITSLDDTEHWDTYPAMVKPNKSQGQRGINKVNNKSELKKAIEKAIENSYTKSAIIEEFIDGFEISVNTYILDNLPMLYFITERNSFQEFPGGIIKSHYFPVTRKLNREKTEKMVMEVCREMGIENGPAYFQIKITSQGEPKIIEVATRFDGCHLWRLIKLLGGPDLFQVTLNHLEGKDITGYFSKGSELKKVKHAELFFFTQKPYTQMKRDEFDVSPHAVYHEWYYEDGEIIRPVNGFMEKAGYQITIEL